MTHSSFLVALRLEGERALVVGSNAEAQYRAQSLTDAGANVRVIAPGDFRESDLDGVRLVVQTDRTTDLASACRARNILYCSIDRPEENSFDHVAIARAGTVAIGVSTGRTAPSLAKRLREELERLMTNAGLQAFSQKIAELRERTPSAERKDVLGRAVAGVRISGKLELPDLADE